jgi:hypothetical protein
MKVVNFKQAKSSFLSVEKDLDIIIQAMLANKRLAKLLVHNRRDALHLNLPEDFSPVDLIGTNIKTVPKLYIDGSVLSYIIISFDNFTPNATNPEFRDNIVSFDIVCHFDQWQLNDLALRPYKIAAEIDTMFDKKHLTGIGTFQFLGANQIVLNDEFAGLSLMYQAVHGGEDKKGMLNPKDEANAVIDFKQYLKELEMSDIDLE